MGHIFAGDQKFAVADIRASAQAPEFRCLGRERQHFHATARPVLRVFFPAVSTGAAQVRSGSRSLISFTFVTLIVSTAMESGREAAMPLSTRGLRAFRSRLLNAWLRLRWMGDLQNGCYSYPSRAMALPSRTRTRAYKPGRIAPSITKPHRAVTIDGWSFMPGVTPA
jgi:hypothetical protein